MEKTSSSPKILRVGLVQKGKVIDERLLRQKAAVTVGDSHRNTFVIPAMNFPARFPLFEVKNDTYYLNFPEWMQGKLSRESMTFTLASACEKDLARPSGHVRFTDPGQSEDKARSVTVYQMKLDEKSRGVLRFGDFALLFQFVVPPPKPKAAALPVALRGGLWKGNDWVYSSILLLSFVAHTSFIYWCKLTGELPAHHAATLTDRFAKQLRCLKNCNKPKKPDQSWLKQNDKPKPRVRTAKPENKPKARRRSDTHKTPRTVSTKKPKPVTKESLKRLGLLAMLTSKGKDGKHRDILAGGGRLGRKLDSALGEMQGVTTSSTKFENNRGSRRGTSLSQQKLSLEQANPGRGGTLGQPGTRRKRARINFRIDKFNVDGGELPQGVTHAMKRIRRYRRSLQYCYELALKRAPGLHGKVLLSITVALNGRVSSAEIEENSLNRQAGKCMVKAVKRWRLFKPKREAVTLTVPFVFFAR